MIVKVRKRFLTDLNKIKSIELLDDIVFLLDEAKAAEKPENIPGFKWLTGYKITGRIELSPYRIGVKVQNETIIFWTILHRSVVYKQFP